MIYFLLCVDFGVSLLASFAIASSGKAVDLIIAAILGVSATVALAGITIVHAIDQLPRPPQPASPNVVQ